MIEKRGQDEIEKLKEVVDKKKKKKGQGIKEQKFTGTAEDAQVKRRIEIQALHLKLSKKESTEKFLTIKCEL